MRAWHAWFRSLAYLSLSLLPLLVNITSDDHYYMLVAGARSVARQSICPRTSLTSVKSQAAFTCRNLHLMGDPNASTAPLRILMLHGYTQSGQLFHAKTKVLEKHLKKAFPSVALSYPTGPMQLRPSDVPGFDSTATDPDDVEAYGWWRRSNTSDPPEYTGIDKGLEVVSQVLESEGPFDGVIGFSQGAALAAMVASLLEGKPRKQAFSDAQAKSSLAIPYPSSFGSLDHPPLKFWVPYSGFVAPGERYEAFYEPNIQTPACHFIGSLDSVVEESRTQKLVDASGGSNLSQVVFHPGGHFVPTGKQYLDTLVAYIKRAISPEQKKEAQDEERVEDMDMPF